MSDTTSIRVNTCDRINSYTFGLAGYAAGEDAFGHSFNDYTIKTLSKELF
ncbi:hypothetical protein [Aliiroseovarius crassostreae]